MATSKATETGPLTEMETQDQYGELHNTYGDVFTVPDFTIKQIRDAIPAHCFQRSALRGYCYIARDIILLASTFFLFDTFVTPEHVASMFLRSLL